MGELCVWQHTLDLWRICGRHDRCLAELSFPAGGFFGQDMACEGMVPHDLSRARDLEALGCAFMGF